LEFNNYNCSYSLHRFTTHKPEACPLVRCHFTSYLIIRNLAVSLLLTLCLSIMSDCLTLQIVLSLLIVSVLNVCRLSPLNCASSATSSICFGPHLSGVFLALLALICSALLLALVCFCLFLTLNCSYLCLHLFKTVFRQPSREHLVELFGLSVVTKTTPPLRRKRLSLYALSRERVYNCHPDNDAYSTLIVAVV
jgi:hypothetical protein